MGLDQTAASARQLADDLAREVEQTTTRQQYIRTVSLAQSAERIAVTLETLARTGEVL